MPSTPTDKTYSTGPAPTVVIVQYLRAIAASLVVLHHAMSPPVMRSYYTVTFGEFGVDLFFVISGLIMWITTAEGRRGTLSFWAARIVRIVPLYWVYTTLFAAVALISPRALFSHAGLDPVFILKSYLFIPAEHPAAGGIHPVYTLGWTLNYEMFFYFVFGLCLFVRERSLRFALLAVVMLGLAAIGQFLAPTGSALVIYTNPLMLEFLAGVALAVVASHLIRAPAMLGAILIAIGVGWLVYVVATEARFVRLVAYGLPALLIVAGALVVEPLVCEHPSRFGLLLGDASYSIYLAHPFAQRVWFLLSGGLLPDLTLPVAAACYFAGALLSGIAGGVVSYLVIERALLRFGHRLIDGVRSARRPS